MNDKPKTAAGGSSLSTALLAAEEYVTAAADLLDIPVANAQHETIRFNYRRELLNMASALGRAASVTANP